MRYFVAGYRGTCLGLITPRLIDSKDGIEHWRFTPGREVLTVNNAVTEWLSYLGSFESIECVELHLRRIDCIVGGGRIASKVRMELTGTPHGRTLAGIDRGYLHMQF